MQYRILIADDEMIERRVLRKKIERMFPGECEVYEASNGREVVENYEANRTQIMILDIRMPGVSGLEAAEKIRELDRSCSIIFLTAFDEFTYARKAIAVRALEYLLKPCDDRELEAAVQEAMRMQSQVQEAEEKKATGEAARKEIPEQAEVEKEADDASLDIRQEQILKYIHEHYAEDLSVQDIAGECGYTDVYFCRIFKQYFGRSFVTFLTDYRITEAKKLLKNTRIGVGEVGRKVGYADPNYFAKVFRRVTGESPKEYRERA